jgi:hypothetical protein
VNFKEYHDNILERLALQAGTLGLSLRGDGAALKRMPLVNMLAAGVHEPAGVLEIAECTGHIQGGGKKDAGFIAGLFLPHMKIIDPDKQFIDCVFFDGASNVQKSGKVMQVQYPRVMVLHGAEHVVSLFFKDLFNIQVLKHRIVRHRFIYRVFGSGAMHSPYALFQRHARAFNNRRPIGLLRASDTIMAGYFMAMHRDLRLKQALQATAEGRYFISLKISKSKDPTATIRDELEYQHVFHLLRATFSALMILRLADSNKPGMGQIYYLTHKATETIEHGIIYLNNKTWFPDTMPDVREFEEMLEEEEESEELLYENEADNIDEISDDDDELEEEDQEFLGEVVLTFLKRAARLLRLTLPFVAGIFVLSLR